MIGLFCFCLLVVHLNASAIPMWEYLSKEEKMSYLYSMFANQVDDFCEQTLMDNCNQELLKYGLGKLKDMSEEHLDSMDPYQRGAHNIIWDSMMEGHKMGKTTPKPKQTSNTPKPNSYDDPSFGDDFEYGSQGSASAKIDNVYKVLPPKDFIYQKQSGKPQYTYPHNVVPYLNQFYETRRSFQKPLTGPMVVKVYPDGRPVSEPIYYPHDEDLRQYRLSKTQLPQF